MQSDEQRYEGSRLAFVVPAGAQVRETTDVVADYALELTLPGMRGEKPVVIRVLASNAKTLDGEVEAAASAWREARLRNRASWGVQKRGEAHAEISHVGARRVVRFADQMGSVLGPTRQLMLCASVSARLVCAVATGILSADRAIEQALTRAIETVAVAKKP